MSVDQGLLVVRAQEGEAAPTPQTMVLQAGSKPLISIMWLGTLLLGLGCLLAAVRRVREARALAAAEHGVHSEPRHRTRRIAAL
jgi:cytochrome c biogenesis factor